jgi:hypothetical protein
MAIQLAEVDRDFSNRDINELEEFLSKVPPSHLDSTGMVTRKGLLPNNELAIACFSSQGGEIKLSDRFYSLDVQEREFTLIHEVGHNYFDFRDYWEGNIPALECGPCRKEDVSHLLRIQWIELGWELNHKNWKKVKALYPPDSAAVRDKYAYTVMCWNPNHEQGEWTCLPQARIPRDSVQNAFTYRHLSYSPIEEMADAYALFASEEEHFFNAAKTSDLVKAKYDFIKKCFADEFEEPVVLER